LNITASAAAAALACGSGATGPTLILGGVINGEAGDERQAEQEA
jgi:hypothetical protein